jgi:hypothetical protein
VGNAVGLELVGAAHLLAAAFREEWAAHTKRP